MTHQNTTRRTMLLGAGGAAALALTGGAFAPSAHAASTVYPKLRHGDRSGYVLTVRALIQQENPGAKLAQGIAHFDSAVVQRVRGFQMRHYLEMDSVVGPQTWGVLLAVPLHHHGLHRRGHRGRDIRTIQKSLRGRYGSVLAADGVFGAITERQVRRFQRSRGILVDGVVGTNTIWELQNGPEEIPGTAYYRG